jgi:uncharacterized protein YyaL (SSP411 family)
MADPSHTNRLAGETSPYLRQHRHNPVDWYPWGEEALARARAEDRPIFLSIGYSACHWCHVMERESFEDPRVAGVMNERFVNIKVDREERPDLDDIYMAATQMLSGQGGWPNSVFLTPDLKPFFAGTYFPPEPRWGRPSFEQVLVGVADAYRSRRADIAKAADEVTEQIRRMADIAPSAEAPGPSLLNRAFGDLAGRFDDKDGGFGGAPKFPHSGDLSFLLRYFRRTGNTEALRMAVVSLDRMALGGIRDHLGGGFHRYSVDAQWLVPHFEKMLYDNALLARVYLEAAVCVAGQPVSHALPAGGREAAAFYREVARDTLDWTLREMTAPEGGFHSSLDADSEGEEGKSYVWTPPQIAEVVGPQEAALFGSVYGVTAAGNFEHGRSILHLRKPIDALAADRRTDTAELRLRLASCRSRLLQARDRRPRPARDDKVLADWNGLMIGAFAVGARVLDEPRYAAAAERAARFVLDRMRENGRLRHVFMDGRARHAALLPDHAHLLAACLDLYETTFKSGWVEEARRLATEMIDLFRDDRQGGFLLTPRDHEAILARPRENGDGATPAGTGVAALALPRLALITGDDRFRTMAEETLRLYRDRMERFPSAFATMLCALDQQAGRQRQIVLAGRPDATGLQALVRGVRDRFDPNALVLLADPADTDAARSIPLLAGKTSPEGRPVAYVCENGACAAPVASVQEIPA